MLGHYTVAVGLRNLSEHLWNEVVCGATRARLEAEFQSLAQCESDDTVIAFSGHGSETHELVTYDSDVSDLDASAIPLDLLQDWFSRPVLQRSRMWRPQLRMAYSTRYAGRRPLSGGPNRLQDCCKLRTYGLQLARRHLASDSLHTPS